MSKYRIVLAVATIVLPLFAWTSATVAAISVGGWTPAKAAATVKARYDTADPTVVKVIQANIDQEKAGANDPAVIAKLEASLEKARHAAKVTSATCKAYKTRFRCTAKVAGVFRAPPDYQLFTATKRLTLTVAGSRYRIVEGWR